MTQESLGQNYKKMLERQKKNLVNLKQNSTKTCAGTLKISFCFSWERLCDCFHSAVAVMDEKQIDFCKCNALVVAFVVTACTTLVLCVIVWILITKVKVETSKAYMWKLVSPMKIIDSKIQQLFLCQNCIFLKLILWSMQIVEQFSIQLLLVTFPYQGNITETQ